MSVNQGHSVHLWSRGNFLLFGVVALALVVFVLTLSHMLGRPEGGAATEPPRKALQDLKVELGDRGKVDLQAKTVGVALKLGGVPDDVAQRMTLKVFIDGREAQIGPTDSWPEVEASAVLEEKVENLVRSNGVGAVLLVKGVCEYDGESHQFDLTVTRLQVVSKTWKEMGLAFANFPESTPTPRPKPKPTPTPYDSLPPVMPEQEVSSSNVKKPPPTNMAISLPTPLSTPPSDKSRKMALRKRVDEYEKEVNVLMNKLRNSNSNSLEYHKLKQQLDEAKNRLNRYRKLLNKPE